MANRRSGAEHKAYQPSPEKIRRLRIPGNFRELQQFVDTNERETTHIIDLDRCPAFVAEVPITQLVDAINTLRNNGILAYPSGDNTIAGYIDSDEKRQFLVDNCSFVVFGLPGPNSYSRARFDSARHTAHLTSLGLIAAYRAFHTQTDIKQDHDAATNSEWHGKGFLMPIDQRDKIDQIRELFPTVGNDPDQAQQVELAQALKATKLLEQPLTSAYFHTHRATLDHAFRQIPKEEFSPLRGKEASFAGVAVRKVDIDHFSKTYRDMSGTVTATANRNETNPEEYLQLVAPYFDKLEDYIRSHTPAEMSIYFSQRLGDAIYVYAVGGTNSKAAQIQLERLINDFMTADTGAAPFSTKHVALQPQSRIIHAIVEDDRFLVSDDLYNPTIVAKHEDAAKTLGQDLLLDDAKFTQFMIDTFGKLTKAERKTLDADPQKYTAFIQSLRERFFAERKVGPSRDRT